MNNTRKLSRFAPAIMAGVTMLSWAMVADADDTIEIGRDVWIEAGCASCHGSRGQGGTDPDSPAGPSLRTTQLSEDEMFEVIACGRRGVSGMPGWARGAYFELACYGETPGQVPEDVLLIEAFDADQIDALVAYIFTTFVQD